MNSDLADLYQDLMLDHYRSPRNCGPLDNADSAADGANPLCGDLIRVSVKLDGDLVADIKFEGSGCAISTASASLMTEAVKGKTIEQAKALFRRFHGVVTGAGQVGDNGPSLGKLEIFAGVGKFPARVKCATLAWHTLDAALSHSAEVVSTE